MLSPHLPEVASCRAAVLWFTVPERGVWDGDPTDGRDQQIREQGEAAWRLGRGMLWEVVSGREPGIGGITQKWDLWGLGSPMNHTRTIKREAEPGARVACHTDIVCAGPLDDRSTLGLRAGCSILPVSFLIQAPGSSFPSHRTQPRSERCTSALKAFAEILGRKKC